MFGQEFNVQNEFLATGMVRILWKIAFLTHWWQALSKENNNAKRLLQSLLTYFPNAFIAKNKDNYRVIVSRPKDKKSIDFTTRTVDGSRNFFMDH